VLRYYTRIADFILPTILDRPLVLSDSPMESMGRASTAQGVGDYAAGGPRRTDRNEGGEKQRRIIGGDLLTLLYTIQLGAISVGPMAFRVQSLEYAD